MNGYAPNIAATWMFQKSFVHPVSSQRPASFVNRLMRQNYVNMEDLGDDVLRPFNQDVVQPRALLKVLGLATLRDPLNILPLCYWIGPSELIEWLGHFGMMLCTTARTRSWGRECGRTRIDCQIKSRASHWRYGASRTRWDLPGGGWTRVVVIRRSAESPPPPPAGHRPIPGGR